MTRAANARLAGSMFLLYIVLGITGMVISPATPGDDVATKLAGIAQHATEVRVAMILGFACGFIAIALAIALYGLTREEDHELALLGMSCRVAEGVAVVVPLLATLGLLMLAAAPDPTNTTALAAYLLKVRAWIVIIAGTFFAVGSTVFTWLMLRGRIIPLSLAWLGMFASVLLVIALPLQLTGVLRGTATQAIWAPMALFEVPLGIWLLVRANDIGSAGVDVRIEA